MRGFHARDCFPGPVRVGWRGTRFISPRCCSVLFLCTFFSHPESCLKIKILIGDSIFFRGGPGVGQGGPWGSEGLQRGPGGGPRRSRGLPGGGGGLRGVQGGAHNPHSYPQVRGVWLLWHVVLLLPRSCQPGFILVFRRSALATLCSFAPYVFAEIQQTAAVVVGLLPLLLPQQ